MSVSKIVALSNDYGWLCSCSHTCLVPITVAVVHVEVVIAIVLLYMCESAQQYRALIMVLQDTEYDLFQCPSQCF